jgi:diaminopimelate epimerase
MHFSKMHGAGNDYVYVDGFQQSLPAAASLPDLARQVSDRHRGIGSDGLILIRPATDADCEMEMYNSDGSRSEMCGNGIRCVAKYVYDRGLARRRDLRVKTGAGVLALRIVDERDGRATRVRVEMGVPRLLRSEIPMGGPPGERAVGVPLHAGDREFRVTALSVGNPHCVVFLHAESVSNFPVERYGRTIESLPLFPNRVNVHFVEPLADGTLRQRTWERGAGETQACGTGATATGIAAALEGLVRGSVVVHLLGGDLEIEWAGEGSPAFMTGPAEHVFDGEWPER